MILRNYGNRLKAPSFFIAAGLVGMEQETGEPHLGSREPHGFAGKRWMGAGYGHVKRIKPAAAVTRPGRCAALHTHTQFP